MFQTLRNAWKVPELRKKLIYTLFLVAIYRLGNCILVPGVDPSKLTQLASGGTLFGFYDLLSGGAFSKCTIFAMAVTPYINSSIIMQLLAIAIPSLEQLQKEGEEGRKKINEYTRYLALALGFLQSFGQYALMTNFGAIVNPTKFNIFLIMLTLTTASTFLMWLGDQITVKGIGNGVSLIIFVNIISRFPKSVTDILDMQKNTSTNIVEVVMFIAVAVALFVLVVVMSLAERRIPVQYAGKTVGNKTFKGQSTHIPINVNSSGIIAIIFAMSVMQFPGTIASFFPTKSWSRAITQGTYSIFKYGSWAYAVIYLLLIVFFTWFYTEVTFKPEEMAENMHKSAGFIPGIRPGQPTAEYIERVLARVSVLGGAFAGIIAAFPLVLQSTNSKFAGVGFTGTGLLIIVGVALETMRQVQSQLMMRHYHGFLN